MADWPSLGDVFGVSLFGGLAGGIVRMLSKPTASCWWRFSTVVTGGLCAWFIAPVLSPVVIRVFDVLEPVNTQKVEALVAFLVGTWGRKIADRLIVEGQRRLGAQ